MSVETLERPGSSPESLLSDQMYHSRTSGRQAWEGPSVPSITIEASPSFPIKFGDGHVFDFEQKPSNWFMPLLKRICELGFLPANWDSYGALPVDPRTAAFTVGILLRLLTERDPSPSVVPTNRGGIQIEWHIGGIDLEIDIQSLSSVDLLFEKDGHEEEHERAGFEIIQDKLNILRDRLQSASGNR